VKANQLVGFEVYQHLGELAGIGTVDHLPDHVGPNVRG